MHFEMKEGQSGGAVSAIRTVYIIFQRRFVGLKCGPARNHVRSYRGHKFSIMKLPINHWPGADLKIMAFI